mmetsp:Transcript_49376/g.77153  ORF Transcript_49376/g.77153 Transcript_49376/m.77153 type:complete len:373 (-) Transcript_49376:65-1183(-)
MAKDKYEQAAMADIQTEENKRYNYTDEGEKMFAGYAQKAQRLMGISEFNSLLNSTRTTEDARAHKEEQTLTALRSASRQLRKIAKSERKLRELKEQEKQAKMNAEEQTQLKKSLAASQYGSAQSKKLEDSSKGHDAERQSSEAQTLKAYVDAKMNKMVAESVEESSRAPYAADEAQAKTIESQRMKAFDKEVEKLKEQTQRNRAARASILQAEKKQEHKELAEEEADEVGVERAEKPKLSRKEEEKKIVHEQMREALGHKEEPSKAVRQAGGGMTSSAGYEESVESALEESLKRTMEDRRAMEKYHKVRNKVLAADAREASKFSGALSKTSEELLQPSQLHDLSPSQAAETANVKRAVSARDREVDMIMGFK